MTRKFKKYPSTAVKASSNGLNSTDSDLREQVVLYVQDELSTAIDNMAMKCADSVPGYDPDYCAESDINSSEIQDLIKSLSDEIAYSLLAECPDRGKWY